MPHFVVRVPGQAEQVYSFQKGEIVVGRGNDADLVLPNVSVSRHHVRVKRAEDGWVVEDLKSRNGLLLNGNTCESALLKTNDEIQVGKFLLVYLGDGRQDQVYKGRFIAYMPAYKPNTPVDGDSTFQIDKADLDRLKAQTRVMREARIVLVTDSRKSWVPRDRELHFGSKSEVPVSGRFTGGAVACIRWSHGYHLFEKTARFTTVLVNGEAINDAHRLKHGDTLTVGNTRFRYDTSKT